MFGNFTEEARKILVMAKKEMTSLKHPYVGSEHLLLAILKKDNSVSQKLKSYDLDYDKVREEIINIIKNMNNYKFEQKEPKLHWYNCKTKEHLLDNNFNRDEMIEKGFVEIYDDGNIN